MYGQKHTIRFYYTQRSQCSAQTDTLGLLPHFHERCKINDLWMCNVLAGFSSLKGYCWITNSQNKEKKENKTKQNKRPTKTKPEKGKPLPSREDTLRNARHTLRGGCATLRTPALVQRRIPHSRVPRGSLTSAGEGSRQPGDTLGSGPIGGECRPGGRGERPPAPAAAASSSPSRVPRQRSLSRRAGRQRGRQRGRAAVLGG